MFVPTESQGPSFSKIRLIDQAIKRMKQNLVAHLEQESRLHHLFAVGQEKWLTQFEQLRNRIELLEARISPWMTEPADRPRLAVIPQQEESA
jgi:hypothetical protein